MAEPFLDFGDVGVMFEGVGGGGGSERVDAEAGHVDPGGPRVELHDVASDRSGMEPMALGAASLADSAKQSTVQVLAMADHRKS